MIGTTKAARPRAPYWELMAAILTLVVLVAGAWLWQAPQTVSAGNLAQELEQWNAGTSVSELLDAGYVEVTDVHDGQDATIEHFLEETSAGRQSVLRVFSRQDGDLQIRILWFDPYVTGKWIRHIEGTSVDFEQPQGLIRALSWRGGEVDGSGEYYAREPERITEGSATQVRLDRRLDAARTSWMEDETWPQPTVLYSYRL